MGTLSGKPVRTLFLKSAITTIAVTSNNLDGAFSNFADYLIQSY